MAESTKAGWWLRLVGMVACHYIVTGIVFALLFWLIPPVKKSMDDLGLTLPVASQWTIIWSNLLVSYWYALVPLWLLADGGLLVGLGVLPSWLRWLQGLWFGGYLLGIVLLLTWMMLGIAMPLIALAHDMGA